MKLEVLSLLSLIIGYLLGSVSPSYMLGKLLKGIDIREHGTKNAGASNTYKVLGLFPAIITATYDFSKGILAMVIAYYLHVPVLFIYLSGIMAVIGHIFPFYLKFRGGQGVACSNGLLLTFLFFMLKNRMLTWQSLVLVAALVLVMVFVARKGEIIGIFVLPTFLYFIYNDASFNLLTIFTGIVMLHMFTINIINIRKDHFLELNLETVEAVEAAKPWRTILRPAAVLFPVFYLLVNKEFILVLVGSVTLFFIIMDLVRLSHSGVNIFLFKNISTFFKKKEERKLTSMTLFLISCFLTFLLFPKNIAIAAVIFLIFGDIFSKFFGLRFGRTKIFNKSLEGSLSYLVFCMIAGFILLNFIPIPPILIIIGSLAATVSELLPLGVDDNLSVALISASAMLVTTVF